MRGGFFIQRSYNPTARDVDYSYSFSKTRSILRQQLLPEHADHLKDRIKALDLGAYEKPILKSAYTAYNLVGHQQAGTRNAGTTRFGGHPDLPRSFDIDQLADHEFVYQVNLTDLPGGTTLGLPQMVCCPSFPAANLTTAARPFTSKPTPTWSAIACPPPRPITSSPT